MTRAAAAAARVGLLVALGVCPLGRAAAPTAGAALPAPPQVQRPARPTPDRPSPEVKGTLTPVAGQCDGEISVRVSRLASLNMGLARGDNDLGGRGRASLQASARFTKRRIIVDLEGSVAERAGDTLFRGYAQLERRIYQRPGCEIASISLSRGRLDVPEGTADYARVEGSGLIESAECRTHWNGYRQNCNAIEFRRITVRLRPFRIDCSDLVVNVPRLSAWNFDESGRYSQRPLDRVIPREWGVELGRARPRVGIQVSAAVDRDGSAADLRVRASFVSVYEEGRSVSLQAAAAWRVLDAAYDRPGCRIEGISPARGSFDGETRDRPNHRATAYGLPGAENPGSSSGALVGAYCVTDTEGRDGSRVGCADIRIRPLTVRLSQL